MDNNAISTIGEHIGDVGSSISAHVLEGTKQPSQPIQSVEDLLGEHFINNVIWGGTN